MVTIRSGAAPFAFAMASFLVGCGSSGTSYSDANPDRGMEGGVDAGSNTTSDAPSDAGSDPGSDAGSEANSDGGSGDSITPEDDQLCHRLAETLAPIQCPDETGRVQSCEEAIIGSGACLPENRVVVTCAISAGTSAFLCDGTETVIRSGFCDRENDALLLCLFGV